MTTDQKSRPKKCRWVFKPTPFGIVSVFLFLLHFVRLVENSIDTKGVEWMQVVAMFCWYINSTIHNMDTDHSPDIEGRG